MKVLRGIGFAIATILLYLGVPWLGWGLVPLGSFIASGERLAYAMLVVSFGLAVGIQATGGVEGIRGGRGQEEKRYTRQTVVRFALVVGLYAFLFLLPFAERRGVGVFGRDSLLAWPGLVLAALGYGFIFWSGLLLGRQYSPEVTIQNGHQLITSGVYARLRHPRYLGILLLAVGLSLVFHSWAGILVSLAVTAVLLFRIRDEEELLHREFGEEWEAYCQRSWRLIPFLF